MTDKISVVPSITPPHPPTPVEAADAALSVRNSSDDASDDEEDEEDVPSLEDVNAPDNAPDEAINTPLPIYATPEPTRHRGPESGLAGSSSSNPWVQAADWVRSHSPLRGSRLAIRRQPSPQRLPEPQRLPSPRGIPNLISEFVEYWNRPSSRRPPVRNREPDDKS